MDPFVRVIELLAEANDTFALALLERVVALGETPELIQWLTKEVQNLDGTPLNALESGSYQQALESFYCQFPHLRDWQPVAKPATSRHRIY